MKLVAHLSITLAILTATAMGTAQASDGTINITGNITATTCKINGASSPVTVSVALPTVSTTALTATGMTAAPTPFTLALTGCTAGATAKTLFELGPNVDTATGNLKNATGTATNVEVAILNSTDAVIDIRNNTNSQTVNLVSSAATMSYYAEYIATGAATSGTVATSVTFSMSYN
jgi:major type 1 subunit fimbrin (pilin)